MCLLVHFLWVDDNSILPFVFCPHFSVWIEVDFSGINEVNEINIDFFCDEISLFYACNVLIVNSTKNHTNVDGSKLQESLDVRTLVWLQVNCLSLFNHPLLIALLGKELNLNFLKWLGCSVDEQCLKLNVIFVNVHKWLWIDWIAVSS